MKKIKHKDGKNWQADSGTGSISTLGEELARKNPELAKRMVEYRTSDGVLNRLAGILHDLFPFNWTDVSGFESGVKFCVQSKMPEAVDLFQSVLEKQPEAYPAYHLLGYAYGALGKVKEEIDHYRRAIKLNPNGFQIFFDLGRAYWRNGKVKKAFAAFKQAVILTPDFDVAQHWLTLSFDMLGRYPDAPNVDERQIREKNRTLAQMYLMLGVVYIEFGLHPAARHAFKEAVRVKADFAEGYYQLGAMHIKKLRNPQRAAKYLKRAEDLFIQQNDLHSAMLAHQLLRPDESGIDKEQLYQDWFKEGLRLQQLGQFQGAVDAYREAIHYRPNLLDAYYNLGIAYGSLHDLGIPRIDRAINAFKEVIRIKPDFKHVYTPLAASYLKQNEFEDALEILSQAVEIDPDNPVVYYYLGIAYRMSSQLNRATEVLKTSVQLKPDSIEGHYSLGMVYFDRMQFSEACLHLEEAVQLKPDFADGHYMLGIIYHTKITDFEKSVNHLRKAEKLYLKMEDYAHAARVKQMLAQQPIS